MNNNEATKLMHAVLDGGASPEERSALERALAADPQARAEFDGLRRMFADLDAMPRCAPPPGFAERVVALQRSMAAGDPARQLFSSSGVIGPSGKDISVRNPSVNVTRPRTPSESIWGNWQMAMSKRGMWIVGGVAAAVAAMFIGGVVDFPPSGDKATGTIAPAKKARGEQPGTDDVKRSKSESGTSQSAPGSGQAVGGAGGADQGAAAGGGGRSMAGANSSDAGAASAGGGRSTAGANSSDAGAASAGGGRSMAGANSSDAGAASAGGGRSMAGANSSDAGAAAAGGGRSAGANSSDAGAAAGGVGKSASAVGSAAGAAVGAAEARKK